MGNHSPSQYRREGRNAFYPGADPEVSCPYSDMPFGMRRACWLEGWYEAKKVYVEPEEYGGYIAALREDHTDEAINAMSNVELVLALDAINERNLKGF